MTEILLADDHPLFLDGLSILLTTMLPDVVVHTAKDVQQVKNILEANSIDFLLLDRIMPGMDGMKRLPELSQLYPGLPISIMSASDSAQHIREAIDNGAIGFIPKTFTPEQIMDAVKKMLLGNIFIPKQAWVTNTGYIDGRATLSARQMEILNFIVQGKSDKAIASELNIVEGTVKQHINNMYRQLKVSNRTLAIQRSRDLGLIP